MPKSKENLPVSGPDRLFFDQFYDAYKRYIFRCAAQLTQSTQDCEDVFQDTVLRLLKNIHVLRQLEHKKTFAYIFLTAKSAWVDHLRKNARLNTVSFDAISQDAAPDKFFASSDVLDWENYSDTAQLKSELTAREWAVLEGKYLLGYSQEELAQLLDVSTDSIRMILSRVRKKAKSILDDASRREDGEGGE